MAASIDTYLRNLSLKYYLKNNSDEMRAISASIDKLYANLHTNLGLYIKRKFIFGSFDRDTILPRAFDNDSDIDIMVIFNHTQYERTPETYRRWLQNFANRYYKYSEVVKTFPTITIRLDHINYDLVPAKEEEGWASSTIYIPSSFGWQMTDPNDVKQRLIASNTRYNNVVRPIIRLLKAWNSYNNYPFDSYLLELEITDMNFNGDNVQQGLFYAVNQLKSGWGTPIFKQTKIKSLRYNISEVENALNSDNIDKAKHWLHRIFPEP